jgi:D-alanyl-D-alanine carboxypeptidase
MVVGVWVPGEGSFVRGFGTSALGTGALMWLSDHFRIASITKSFTAVAILRLVDRHRLSLTAHLSTFVKGIPNGNRITVAELLNMTSGIYDYTGDVPTLRAYDRNPQRRFSLRDVVAIIQRHRPLFAPGAAVAYDNSNYYLLDAIAQRVVHLPFGEVVRNEILRPLGLRHTSYPPPLGCPRRSATVISTGRTSRPETSLAVTPPSLAAPAR